MNESAHSLPAGFGEHSESLMVGAALVGVGSLIALCGLLTGGTAVIAVLRRWLRDLDQTPGELLRQKLDQGKAAANASATAWHQHDGSQTQRTRG